MLSKNPVQTSVDSLAPASRPTNTGRPSLVIPHAARTGSDRAPSCMAGKVAAVQEQVLQRHLGQVPGLPAVELVLDLLAHPENGRLRQGRFRPEGVGQAGRLIWDR